MKILKFLMIVLMMISACLLVSSATYTVYRNSTYGFVPNNVSYSFARNLYVAGTLSAGSLGGNVNWTSLQNYPSACPTGTAITTLADTPTCLPFISYTNTSWILSNQGYNTSNQIKTVINSSNLNMGLYNITIGTTNRLCLDGTPCTHYIWFNSTHTVIK